MTNFNYVSFVDQLDLFGTMVFAISGMIVSRNQGIDLFGGAVISFVTALGGGTLRDIMIGSTPVGWMLDIRYILAVVAGIILALSFGRLIAKWNRTMFFFDAIGIGLFTILGIQKTLTADLAMLIALLMGVVSAVFGGVLRDVLVNRIPLIFRSEIYATACLSGGTLYLILTVNQVLQPVAMLLSVGSIIIVRILAVRYKWKFPTL